MNSFWIGFIIGWIIAIIIGFIIECLCIVTGKSDIDTWLEPSNSHVDEDKR